LRRVSTQPRNREVDLAAAGMAIQTLAFKATGRHGNPANSREIFMSTFVLIQLVLETASVENCADGSTKMTEARFQEKIEC